MSHVRMRAFLSIAATSLFVAAVAAPIGAQSITEFSIPTSPSNPFGIAPGSDGNVWFTETLGVPHKVARITPSGTVTEYALPATQGALAITLGPDGALWFTMPTGRITTAGVVTPSSVVPGGQYIATGPDHKLWVTETPNKIARVDPSDPPSLMAEYTIPSPATTLGGVTPGPDGNVWFTETDHGGNAARVARIDLTKLTG